MPVRSSPLRNAPGSTISTLIPNGATSAATASDSPSSANFVADYAPTPAKDVRPPMLEICTMAPDLRRRMCGSTARISVAGTKKCTSISSRSSRSPVSSTPPTSDRSLPEMTMPERGAPGTITSMYLRPAYSLRHFQREIESAEDVPFYGILLYAGEDGLDGRVRDYVVTHWRELNALTGAGCLLFAVEDEDAGGGNGVVPRTFHADEVYDIARHLGVPVASLPCLVLMAEPAIQNETLVVGLRDLLPPADQVGGDDMTMLLRALVDLMAASEGVPPDRRLKHLGQQLRRHWSQRSPWPDRLQQLGRAFSASVATASTIIQALAGIEKLFQPAG